MSMKMFASVAVGALVAFSSLAHAQDSAVATKTSNAAELKKWSIKYQNYTNGPAFEEPAGTSINHYLDVSRKFGDWTAAAVGRLDSNRTIGKDEIDTRPGDHYVKLVTPKAGSAVTINGNIRYYFPTSDASKDAGQDFQFVPRVYILSDAVRNLEFSSVLMPRFYGYDHAADGQVTNNVSNYFEFLYSVASFMTIDLGVEPGYKKVRGTQNWASNDTPIYPGFTAKFTENFSVQPYVEIFSNRPKYKTSSIGAFVNYVAL